jgi:hypothetical protein
MQVRTSYLPSEILWGHRLAPLLTYQKENGQYRIDYTQFHAVEPVKMPECSAQQLAADGRRALSEDNEDDDHDPVYFTTPAVKFLSASYGRQGIIRRMRTSLQRRRNRSRLDMISDSSLAIDGISKLPASDDVTETDRSAICNGDDSTGETSLSYVRKDGIKSNNENNNVIRSISFA